jgi:rRNA maturation endonuclease Nob1
MTYKMRGTKAKVLFKRPCIKCGKIFRPSGHFHKVCPICNNSLGGGRKHKNKKQKKQNK